MMAEFIDMIDGYKIQKGSRDYIVSNVNGKYENQDCPEIINPLFNGQIYQKNILKSRRLRQDE